jgi:hypothetical protein
LRERSSLLFFSSTFQLNRVQWKVVREFLADSKNDILLGISDIDYHSLLGAAASIIGFIGYIPYYRDVLRRTTRPHPFTYGIWALLSTITLAAQLAKGAGPGAWVTAVPAVTCAGIAILAVFYGDNRMVVATDWILLAGALCAIVTWRLTYAPLYAVIISTLASACAFVPTFRKSYSKPGEETALSYSIGALRSCVAIPALLSFNLATLLPLLYNIAANVSFVTMLLVRRHKHDQPQLSRRE